MTVALDLCASCGTPSTSVIVTINGWVLDVCDRCARHKVDPLLTPSEVTE